MTDMETKGDAFAPQEFVGTMRQCFPLFAERTQQGGFKQQDADECLVEFLQSWRPMLKALDEDKEDVVGNLFEVELDVETKCAENEHEPSTHNKERVLKLSCFIDNNNNPIDNMKEGI